MLQGRGSPPLFMVLSLSVIFVAPFCWFSSSLWPLLFSVFHIIHSWCSSSGVCSLRGSSLCLGLFSAHQCSRLISSTPTASTSTYVFLRLTPKCAILFQTSLSQARGLCFKSFTRQCHHLHLTLNRPKPNSSFIPQIAPSPLFSNIVNRTSNLSGNQAKKKKKKKGYIH